MHQTSDVRAMTNKNCSELCKIGNFTLEREDFPEKGLIVERFQCKRHEGTTHLCERHIDTRRDPSSSPEAERKTRVGGPTGGGGGTNRRSCKRQQLQHLPLEDEPPQMSSSGNQSAEQYHQRQSGSLQHMDMRSYNKSHDQYISNSCTASSRSMTDYSSNGHKNQKMPSSRHKPTASHRMYYNSPSDLGIFHV